MLASDFNLVRSMADKSNGIVSAPLAVAFNDAIHNLGIDELPLVGCHFT